VTTVLIGPRTSHQLAGLLGAAEIELTDAALDRIDEIVASGTELAADREHLIRLFEQRVPLQSIVDQLRLPPLLAVEPRRQYDLLVSASGQPSLAQR
jgi:hypothetical protein